MHETSKVELDCSLKTKNHSSAIHRRSGFSKNFPIAGSVSSRLFGLPNDKEKSVQIKKRGVNYVRQNLQNLYNDLFPGFNVLSNSDYFGANVRARAEQSVGWYKGENNAIDSRLGNNGALQGGATYAAGRVGRAFSLNGTNAFVQAASTSANDPTTAGSLEAWVNFNQLPSAAGRVMEIIGKGGGGADFDLQAEPDNRIRFFIAGGTNVASTTVVQTGIWYHVVGTWDSTVGLKIYINGSLENSNGVQVTRNTSGLPLQIGNQPFFGPRLFNGLIDEASIYNGALSAAEAQAIYNAGAAGKCTAPTAATVTVGGQVKTFAGHGITDALVTITDASGTAQTVSSGKLGNFRFNDLEAGATYILSVRAKRFRFSQPTQVVSVNGDLSGVEFTALP